jgi:cytochrome d ubiquinol oxidase subunit II
MNVDVGLTGAWAAILVFAVFAYVVMDGFDLGIGILFAALDTEEERNQAMNAIAPVWDGNETWLVLGGGGLMAAFPAAYAIILPATYPLVIAMLLGLIFRGVAFEFRWREPRHRAAWEKAFWLGSCIAAIAQGVMLGAILQGIRVSGQAYAGGWLDWLTPFSVLTGLSLAAGYALLGACWLIWKLEGPAQNHAFRLAVPAAMATLLGLAAVSAYTPFLHVAYWQRWFALPHVLLTAQVPLLTVIIAWALFRALRARAERAPFLLSLSLFVLGFIGLGISLYPYLVPRSLTLWQAAAPAASQRFMLVGVIAILPLILGYTAWAYWVFRGKTGTHGYH